MLVRTKILTARKELEEKKKALEKKKNVQGLKMEIKFRR